MKKRSAMKNTLVQACLAVILLSATQESSAQDDSQSIPITIDDELNEKIFDGKWTHVTEWKHSSLVYMRSESTQVTLRISHLGDFIYVLVDAVHDTTPDEQKDHAMVCFDTKIDNNTKPDTNNYCFISKLGSEKGVTLRWSEESQSFEMTESHSELIIVGGISDENDRYSKVPHASYEFKIPLELFGRYDSYGFFASSYDHSKTEFYTWPFGAQVSAESEIPDRLSWGFIYSPDKSLAEYELPISIFLISILFTFFVTTKLARRTNYRI